MIVTSDSDIKENCMKKILVLGAAGMAGHVVFSHLKETGKFDVAPVCFRTPLPESLGKSLTLNARDETSLRKIVKENASENSVVINCIGVLTKGARQNLANCIYVNAWFPHLLSEILSESKNSRLVHISTDCVFSGEKGNYVDTDKKDATDVYGMTKNLGEVVDDKNLTIRTSIIGPELKTNGEGLFDWVFSKRKDGKLDGWTKSIWSGVTTLELAKVIEKAIDENLAGLLQVSNNEKISKFSLVSLIVKEFGLAIKVNAVDGVALDKSIVASEKLSSIINVPSYEKMIRDLRGFMEGHKEIYERYFEKA